MGGGVGEAGSVGWQLKKWLSSYKKFLIFKFTGNFALSENEQPIWFFFLWVYSQFDSFSEFTANSALSPIVLLSVYCDTVMLDLTQQFDSEFNFIIVFFKILVNLLALAE